MKIQTITCHNVYNYGASLQAYALTAYLRKLGHTVEIIDYQPFYLRRHRLWGVDNPVYDKPVVRTAYNLYKFPRRLSESLKKRKKAFDRFTERYLPLTEKQYRSYDELCADPPQADVYLAGSDQIWNPLLLNGKDPSFYLSFAPRDRIRASYAASFAVEELSEEQKAFAGERIDALQFCSVREQSGEALVRSMGWECRQVADPVFLLSAQEWEALAVRPENPEPYLLWYHFENNDEMEQQAREIAGRNGWKLWSLNEGTSCDRCIRDAGPLEFLGLIRDAQMVLSDSFHVTAFAILFERPFLVFDRKLNINVRLHDLLYAAGIAGNGTDDFRMPRERIERQRLCSRQYLADVLQAAQEKKAASSEQMRIVSREETRNPLLSIVVPVYNAQRYLQRCVDSALAQTLRDFELILVDDGSPDGCPAMCDAYAKQDGRVVVIHEQNGGPSKARNTGIAAARGEYLYFLDSDDWLEPDGMERLMRLMQTYSVDFVRHRGIRSGSTEHKGDVPCMEEPIREMQGGLYDRERIDREIMPRLLATSEITLGPIITPWGSLFRTAFLKENNLGFHEDTRLNEDIVFSAHVLCHTKRFYFEENACAYHYFYNPDSLTKGFRTTRWENSRRALIHAREDFKQHPMYDFAQQLDFLSWHLIMQGLNEHRLIKDRQQCRAYCRDILRDPVVKACPLRWTRLTCSWKLKLYFVCIKLRMWRLIAATKW